MTIAAQSVPTSTARKGQITGWHVLVGVVAFFALIIAVDVVFMVLAYRTFSGQVASNPYEAGLAFNKTLAQREREAALGWSAAVQSEGGGAVVVRVAGSRGASARSALVDGIAGTSGDRGRQAGSRLQAAGRWPLSGRGAAGRRLGPACDGAGRSERV